MMSRRLQVTLDDRHSDVLHHEQRPTGASLARLIRRAIDVPDHLIAATAERLELELWTRNVRHFPMVPDLRPAY